MKTCGSAFCVFDRFVRHGDVFVLLVLGLVQNENLFDFFKIYDYIFKDGRAFVKSYRYRKKDVSLDGLKLRWFEQRSDYFETE